MTSFEKILASVVTAFVLDIIVNTFLQIEIPAQYKNYVLLVATVVFVALIYIIYKVATQ